MADDAQLAQLFRGGDDRAVEELFRRHYRAVLSYAGRLSRDPQTAEDLASEAFARTLRTVRSGTGGPSGDWRPYLYVVVRNTATAWARTEKRVVLTGEVDDLPVEAEAEPDDTLALAVQAYESLPERWKTVLWHTLIEGESPDRVADRLGTTANNVNVLAFRAREGLRRAYLSAHLTTVTSSDCHTFADRIAIAVRKPRTRVPRALREHLDSCPDCSRAFTELHDLNTTLRAAFPIALLLPAAAQGGSAAVPGAVGTAVVKGDGLVAAAKGIGGKSIAGLTATGVGLAVATAFVLWPDANATPPSPPPTRAFPAAPVPSASTSASSAPPRPKPVRKSPTAGPVSGSRLRVAMLGTCVGADGNAAVALPCGDRRTAWRRDGGGQFRLVNKVSGECLSLGERYDKESFGGGIWAVRMLPCAKAGTWSTPTYTDQVSRLVSNPEGAALSTGKTFNDRYPAPTAFIAYGAYTGSAEQRFTLS